MPQINIDIFARLHQRSLRNTEKEAQKRFQELGQKAADDLTKGVEKAAPKIRRAMHSAADAAGDYTKKTKDLTKAQKEKAEASERAARNEDILSTHYAQNAKLADAVAKSEEGLKNARKSADAQSRGITTREDNLKTKREEHAKTAAKLRQEELKLKDVRLSGDRSKALQVDKGLQDLRKQSAREAATIRAKELELGRARDELGRRTEAVQAAEQRLADLRKDHAANVTDIEAAEKDLEATRKRLVATDTELVRINDEVTKSNRKREESLRRLAEAEDDHEKRSKRGGHNGKGSGGAGVIGNMLTDLPFVPSGRAGAVIGSGMLVGLASAAQAAVTASQSIAVLPAILAAAGAGFATLAIGTHGFSDALKDMGDPDKFATALQSLAPAAQQAALEIQYLVQGPLGELKNATQDTLFQGVAEQIHGLTNEFLPEIQGLTTGVAGSFNNMFGNAVGQLMTPETSTSISNIINNIVAAFQHLEPAVAPFVSAIAKLTETGSSFLPGFADAITNAANSFNNFITTAQQNGSLQDFIQKGLDAAVTLGHVLWDLGRNIMETFGNKDPSEFKQTLDDMVNTAMGVVQAIVGISHAVNDILKAIEPVAQALGGWENLVKVAGGAFLAWKTIGVISTVAELAGLLGVGSSATVGGALTALPGIAATAASGVSAALAAITIPAAFLWVADKFLKDAPPSAENARARGTKGLAQGTAGPWNGGGGSFGADTKGWWPGNVDAPPPPAKPGSLGNGITAGLPAYNPFDIPQPTPKDADGSKITETERRDRIRAGLDPNSFMPDMGAMPTLGGGPTAAPNFGSQPGAPGSPSFGTPDGGLPPLQFGTNGDPYQKPGYGYNNVDPRDVADADYKRTQEARDLRDAKMDLAVLEKDDLATQEELLHAQEKVWDEQHQFDNAQLDYQEALQGKWKKVSSNMSQGMDQIGAHLDRDLGLSKGLSGLADNLVRFVGNLATAPLQQMLQNIINAHPNEGSGVVGIMAAQGAFGSQFTPQGIAAGQGQGGGSGSFLSNGANGLVQGAGGGPTGVPYGLPGGANTGGYGTGTSSTFPPWVMQMAQMFGIKPSTYGGHQESDRQEAGYAPNPNHENRGIDWTGPTENLQKFADYLSTIPQDLEQVIWQNPNTGAKTGIGGGQINPGYYPQGTYDEHGGNDPSNIHVHTRQSQAIPLPGQGGGGGVDPMAIGYGGGTASFAGSSIPLPLPVTIVGSGYGGGIGAPAGSAASGQGIGALPGPSASGIATPAGAGAEAWRDTVSQVFDKYASAAGANPAAKQQWVDAIVKQIDTESKGNPGADNPNDSNGQGGTQHVSGLLQYLPSSYANSGGKLTGLPYMDPIGQIAGALMAPRTASGAPDITAPGGIGAGHGWGPTSRPLSGGIPASGGGQSGGPGPSMPIGAGLGSNPAVAGGPGLGAQPGIGAGLGAQPGYQPTQQPQAQQGWQAGAKGGGGGGGIIGAAAGAAAGMFPGGGAAAQIAMQMIQRTIQYGGEVAGSLAKGAMDFFSVSDPDGGAGASIGDSWLGRLAGSVASGAPALPSSAGKMDQNAQQLAQQQGAQGQQGQQGQGNGPLIGTMNVQADKATGQQMANQMQYASAAAGLIPVG